MEILNSICKIKLLTLVMVFFVHGYSTPMDTVKKHNCTNGFLMQINGKQQCVDTTVRYYSTDCDGFDEYFSMLISINLQLMGEPNWNNDITHENKLRICFIECTPNFDSIVLYSFTKQNDKYIKLIKKVMPVYYPASYVRDTSQFMYEYFGDTKKIFFEYDYSYKNIEEKKIVNYNQLEFFIHKKKMPKLIKQLKKYPTGNTLELWGWSPFPIIEYICNGNYYQIIYPTPKTLIWLPPRMFSK